MKVALKARVGAAVWTRAADTEDWHETRHASISAAKKANGLNSTTRQTAAHLPPKRESA